MSAQDRTLDHYQELMTINATSHVLRTGRELGLFDALLEGQKTLEVLAERTGLPESRLLLLLRPLTSVGIIEKYAEDYAISSVARLLCQYDADLGDAVWKNASAALKSESQSSVDTDVPQSRFDSIAATQWVHTPAAMQAAEILDFGPTPAEDGSEEGEGTVLSSEESEPQTLLDLGCGSAVWSCAAAHRDPQLRVTLVDHPGALEAAMATANSIELGDRFESIEGDALTAELPEGQFDHVLIAQRLNSYSPDQIRLMLQRATSAVKPGGRVIVIDSFEGPNRPSLAESIEALRIGIETEGGAVPELKEAQERMKDAGLESIQFTFIAASRVGLGLMTGIKP
ncbi:MAG TPA: methyltransferase domain-containing protein [Rhodopirellula baltica]|uniref:Probable C-methyltransferase n=1 Tax=Rhodopirellula baltica (strain DSM 10527 / NCIMB 13988 / SH1) TaxID=243090 RepID=Q7UKG8_RHOBA|nr:class I SAM-dependent methyltransferase [Rhodopirellula baltica]CAD76896.1 probable C-methyltransferase [Rhodopirellula baltica SH 1]HBE64413.1 methyltransferase domain-containing protein [Rhodopirellula baltica]